MKKIMAILLCVAMLFTLAACNTSNGPATKVININLTEEDYAFGVDKAQPELLTKVNDFVKKIKDDGTLETIFDKYFGDGEKTPVESAKLDPTKDQLVVATNAAFAPFEYTEGDKFLGVDMEIAKLLADELKMELVIQHMDFDAVCLSVGQHKCDIAMAGLTVNKEREEHVTFSEPYYEASQMLIVKGNDTTFDECKTAADVETLLNGMDKSTKIGVQDGTTGQLYSAGDADWGFPGFPVDTVGYKNGTLAVQDMINGNINYVIIDAGPAAFITESINAMA
ncbi:MAG: transporter substrate-binding domain-containing protein [Clostridia bacterium]|nr:transporter substrate-binding domain-containing protein [Clostridia bacterium]MBQ4612818.1 transporter substrate-binding domain-containing protein [Clostridia bacterium]